jgi:hypothetical protein
MRNAKPSSSDQTVTLARAHLHRSKIIDDPWAEGMLTRRLQLVVQALRRRPFSRYGRSVTYLVFCRPYVLLDDVVRKAIGEGRAPSRDCRRRVRHACLAGPDPRRHRLVRAKGAA